MSRRSDEDGAAPTAGGGRHHLSPWHVVGWIVLGCVLVLAEEEVLDLTALSLFPHHDTAECAGADPFCSPDGRSGLTGGAVVVLLGTLAALAVCAALLLVRRRRGIRPSLP